MSAAEIRALNDAFRTTMSGGRIVMTAGVNAYSKMHQVLILERVREFDEFTKDNDPHGEHDFGAFEFLGRKFFFKIDYYDAAMEFGSEDPADATKTTRVLTIMLASECAPGKLACSSEVEDLTLSCRAGCG